MFLFKTSFTISQVIETDKRGPDDIDMVDLPPLPEKDPNRINILLLGGRGLDDPGEGKLLSDTIMVASIEKGEESNKVALISVPRDLYVRLWCLPEKKKINVAYAYGGLDCVKNTVAITSGLYIDYAASVNFDALVETVDTLGGIDIHLTEPFEETFQWALDGQEEDEYWHIEEFEEGERWVFRVPAGASHLNGSTTLYYVRSRFSSSDFDRMRRQQQVVSAIKDRVLSLGVLANPVKVYNLLDIIGKHVRTDAPWSELVELTTLVYQADTDDIKKKIFDDTPEGLLYHTFVDDEYVLLPTAGNFSEIQAACRDIFD